MLEDFVYAPLTIDFDHELFAKEYDEHILPSSVPIANGYKSWETTRFVNRAWGMVSAETYDRCDVRELDSLDIRQRGIACWMANSMIELETDNSMFLATSRLGSVALRNNLLGNGKYHFRSMFKGLAITKWIQSLPLTNIIGIRCVSLAPNTFASIHRDSNNFSKSSKEGSINSNKLWRAGFVSISINITDGGVPLYYCMDSDLTKPYKVNDTVYMFNDYFYHGVPMTNSRRRQIRVTGQPTDELMQHIDQQNVHLTDNVYLT
jgi:hypothetical protein